MTDSVVIKEVAARDGLQAQPKHLTLAQRQQLIEALACPNWRSAVLSPLKPFLKWRAPMFLRLICLAQTFLTQRLCQI